MANAASVCRVVKLLLPYVTHVINFSRLPHFSACNIEKLGGAWVRGYSNPTVINLVVTGYMYMYFTVRKDPVISHKSVTIGKDIGMADKSVWVVKMTSI